MKTLEERFFSKVNKIENGCWEWIGCKQKTGYGKIGFGGRRNNKTLLSHRVSYQIHYGEFDKNLLVCHKCDNPSCVNPEHLFLGTYSDNNKDKMNKGRANNGEKNHLSKLNENEVKEIKILLSNGLTCNAIGKKYNITREAIQRIKNNKNWKHIH